MVTASLPASRMSMAAWIFFLWMKRLDDTPQDLFYRCKGSIFLFWAFFFLFQFCQNYQFLTKILKSLAEQFESDLKYFPNFFLPKISDFYDVFLFLVSYLLAGIFMFLAFFFCNQRNQKTDTTWKGRPSYNSFFPSFPNEAVTTVSFCALILKRADDG